MYAWLIFSLSYLKVSFRKVVRQRMPVKKNSLSLIFSFIQKTERTIFRFLPHESLILFRKDIHYCNNSGYSSLKVFCIGFHTPELYQRKAQRVKLSRWLQLSISFSLVRSGRLLGSLKNKPKKCHLV